MQAKPLSLNTRTVTPTAIPADLPITLGTYVCKRYGRSKQVHVIEVKNGKVIMKEALDRKDSFSLSAVKFRKLYTPE